MNLFATTVRRVAGAWPCSELELNHVVSTVWGDAKGSRLEQSLFCRVGHCFSSLMWFIPSSQGRRIHLELTAHCLLLELLLCKLPFCKALPASMCLWSTPGKPACTQTEGGHETQASVVWCGEGSLEESKTTPVAQSCSPSVFLGLQG